MNAEYVEKSTVYMYMEILTVCCSQSIDKLNFDDYQVSMTERAHAFYV